jgi:hypothetical protein
MTRPFSGTPVAPFAGRTCETEGSESVTIVRGALLLASPFTVTTTFPVVAPTGTSNAMLVELQLVGTTPTPLSVTVLDAWDEPKFVPVMVSRDPMVAEDAERFVMLGTWKTVNDTPLEVPFVVVTTTFPVVAPPGTGTTILVDVQLVGVPPVPLNVTVLLPCVEPKLTPEMVTAVPAGPEVGDMLFIVGVCDTVKGAPLLAVPLTVITTFPEVAANGTGTTILVALQLVGVPVAPLNVTVLLPCVEPKLAPLIVTDVSGTAAFGDKLVIEGAAVCTANVSETLSKVPVANDEVLPLVTTNPT